MWSDVDTGDIQGSWSSQLAAVVAMLTQAQVTAARQAEPWLNQQLGTSDSNGQVVPEAFSGHSSDGRLLSGMLMYPAWVALSRIKQGLSLAASMASGAAFLDLLVRTQVADAGRAADSVGMAARTEIAGHERVVGLPACGRCIILAGRLYRWSDHFLRHPRCDCTMQPVTTEEWRSRRPDNNPRDLFAQMSSDQQTKAFGQAGAQAIRDGADVGQVVNARRGMTTATAYGQQVRSTTEGTTRRGQFGRYRTGEDGTLQQRSDSELTRQSGQRYRSAQTPRLMPEEIYARAEDREHAIRLLRQYGYLRSQ